MSEVVNTSDGFPPSVPQPSEPFEHIGLCKIRDPKTAEDVVVATLTHWGSRLPTADDSGNLRVTGYERCANRTAQLGISTLIAAGTIYATAIGLPHVISLAAHAALFALVAHYAAIVFLFCTVPILIGTGIVLWAHNRQRARNQSLHLINEAILELSDLGDPNERNRRAVAILCSRAIDRYLAGPFWNLNQQLIAAEIIELRRALCTYDEVEQRWALKSIEQMVGEQTDLSRNLAEYLMRLTIPETTVRYFGPRLMELSASEDLISTLRLPPEDRLNLGRVLRRQANGTAAAIARMQNGSGANLAAPQTSRSMLESWDDANLYQASKVASSVVCTRTIQTIVGIAFIVLGIFAIADFAMFASLGPIGMAVVAGLFWVATKLAAYADGYDARLHEIRGAIAKKVMTTDFWNAKQRDDFYWSAEVASFHENLDSVDAAFSPMTNQLLNANWP